MRVGAEATVRQSYGKPTESSTPVTITVLFLATNLPEMNPIDLNKELNIIEKDFERCRFGGCARALFNRVARFNFTAGDISSQLPKYEPQILEFGRHTENGFSALLGVRHRQ